MEVALAQREAQILSIRAEAHMVLNQTTEATRLADLSCTHNRELHPLLIRRICEKFVQTMQMRQLFYLWFVPMTQGIICNLVVKVLSTHSDYVFNQQTIDLHLAPKPTFDIPGQRARKQRIYPALCYIDIRMLKVN